MPQASSHPRDDGVTRGSAHARTLPSLVAHRRRCPTNGHRTLGVHAGFLHRGRCPHAAGRPAELATPAGTTARDPHPVRTAVTAALIERGGLGRTYRYALVLLEITSQPKHRLPPLFPPAGAPAIG
jgi:hypothetical protein